MPNCPKSTFFGVFDGHGGNQISKKLIELIPNVRFLDKWKVVKNQVKSGKKNIS